MKLTYIAFAVVALSLTAGMCEKERDPVVQAECQKNVTKEECAVDDRCEWFKRSDDKEVCRQDTGVM